MGLSENYIMCYNLQTFEIESIQELNNDISFLELDYIGKFFIIQIGKDIIHRIEFSKWLEKYINKSQKVSLDVQIPFRAYKGSEPYIFVSYTHRDKDLVYKDCEFQINLE